MKTVILKVGQVWNWKGDPNGYFYITAIDNGVASGTETIGGRSAPWARVDANSLAEIHDKWILKDETAEVAKTVPLSRECLCGIFRGDCDYHRAP